MGPSLADDLMALTDTFALKDTLIFCVPIGGMIAQSAATKCSELVSDLVLSNTSYRMSDPDGWNAKITKLYQVGTEGMTDNVMTRWFSESYLRDQPVAAVGYRKMLTRTPLSGVRDTCCAIRDPNLLQQARQITYPKMCISNNANLATPHEIITAPAKKNGGPTEQCLQGLGHLPRIEATNAMTAIFQMTDEDTR